jgi:hypothetical protein
VLSAALPGSFTAAGSGLILTRVNDNGAGFVAGYAIVTAASALVQFLSTLAGVGFAIAANTTEVDISFAVEVQ